MVRKTADPRGDVYHHARSALIQSVSGVTLETFMSSFNALVSAAGQTDAQFYEERGVRLHALEVTSYACKDQAQADILQQIIRETTNRINSLQKQKSLSEIERERLQNELALERSRQELAQLKVENEHKIALQTQTKDDAVAAQKLAAETLLEKGRHSLSLAKAENDRRRAAGTGDAEGLRFARSIHRFFGELNETLSSSSETLSVYKWLGAQQARTDQLEKSTKNLGQGTAKLFLTPADLNLKLQAGSSGLDDDDDNDGNRGGAN